MEGTGNEDERATDTAAGRPFCGPTDEGTKRKEINSYAEREAELEEDVEAIFSKWKRKNPYVGFYGQLDVVFQVNSHWIPVILQAVQLAYDRAMEDAAEEEEEED